VELFLSAGRELNSKDAVDYEAVLRLKLNWFKRAFHDNKDAFLASKEFRKVLHTKLLLMGLAHNGKCHQLKVSRQMRLPLVSRTAVLQGQQRVAGAVCGILVLQGALPNVRLSAVGQVQQPPRTRYLGAGRPFCMITSQCWFGVMFLR
jgi:hypothetical protein